MRNPIRNSAHSQTEQVEQVQGPVQQAAGLESLELCKADMARFAES